MLKRKKILALSAMIIIIAPVLIFLALFIHQKYIQHQMAEKLENASLECITVADGDFTWVKENKEIEINNRLFDVKHFFTKNGKTVFTGLYDDEEIKIKKSLADLIKNENKNKIPGEQLLKLLFNPAITFTEDNKISNYPANLKTEYLFFNDKTVSLTLPLFTPPPNI